MTAGSRRRIDLAHGADGDGRLLALTVRDRRRAAQTGGTESAAPTLVWSVGWSMASDLSTPPGELSAAVPPLSPAAVGAAAGADTGSLRADSAPSRPAAAAGRPCRHGHAAHVCTAAAAAARAAAGRGSLSIRGLLQRRRAGRFSTPTVRRTAHSGARYAAADSDQSAAEAPRAAVASRRRRGWGSPRSSASLCRCATLARSRSRPTWESVPRAERARRERSAAAARRP